MKKCDLKDRLTGGRERLLWLLMSVVSLGGMVEIPSAINMTQPQWLLWIAVIFISLFKGSVFTFLFVVASPKKWMLSLLWAATSVYTLFCLINFLSSILYGFGITHRLIMILAQTNLREIMEFMPDFWEKLFTARTLLFLGGAAAAVWILCILILMLKRRTFLLAFSITSLIGTVTMILCVATFSSRAALIMGVKVPKNIVNTIQENIEYQKIINFRRPLPYADKVESPHEPLTVVMVIGESAHRRHHNLYGYPLNTTPHLSEIRDSLFVFSNAIASSQSTAGNIERVLTLKTDDKTCGDWYKYPLIYDIFKAAGFKTFWLSNQERKGLISNASGAMAAGADVVEYVGVESSEDAYAYRYDDALLPSVQEAIKDTASAKFIGVHLLGSHSDYVNRYPNEEAVFTANDILRTLPRPWLDEKKATTVAQYDNSIHFTDKLLGQIIKMCASMSTPAVFVYFSDHGEMVYDTEDFRGRNQQCVEVPFIVYANNGFRTAHTNLIDALSVAVSLPISTANVPLALLTVARIKYPLYNPANDFLSPHYKIRPRMVDEAPWEYENHSK